ncbi:MAG TPA: helix-turn-helix transcriptional regulator [Flavobacteriales bacterium]|nr:helix-turn-helix transcriptional regulator [Flavobacteriales bacterium]HRE98243.1 helix-turn-helix transcriptional regulator [Flavobacteriales bacterium]HRJ36328.1 helix-turn-helix transcriptional regulator [Flavobacteriales bacterium]HRJ37796.1 helix-turn-helix transcriptional regulator [Flavobacteriales bacterium]
MDKASLNYLSYMESAKSSMSEEHRELIEPLIKEPDLFLPIFHQMESVLFFIDYSSNTYPYISPNSKAVQGYSAELVKEEGPSNFLKRFDHSDLVVINEKLFPELLRMVKSLKGEELHHHKFCLNYRIILPDGKPRMLHQQSNILKVNNNHEPLLIAGTMTHMKDGYKPGEMFLRFSRFHEDRGWELVEELLFKTNPGHKHPELSDAEKKVLVHIQKGLTSKEAARELNLSPETINRHRKNIIKKLNASNMIEALQISRDNGLM